MRSLSVIPRRAGTQRRSQRNQIGGVAGILLALMLVVPIGTCA